MRLDELVTLGDVLSMNQYVKLLGKMSTKLGSEIDTNSLKNQIIQDWQKGLRKRKHYDTLLSTLNINLSDLLD